MHPLLCVPGVVFNKVGGDFHAQWLREALASSPATANIVVLGALPNDPKVNVPERHLGLHMPEEGGRAAAESRIAALGELVAAHMDLDALIAVARQHAEPVPAPTPLQVPLTLAQSYLLSPRKSPSKQPPSPAPSQPAPQSTSQSPWSPQPQSESQALSQREPSPQPLNFSQPSPPASTSQCSLPGPDQTFSRTGPPATRATPGPPVRIGVARDAAFCFYYSDNLRLLEAAGATLVFFSPLTDDSLPPQLHALYFGGGYPELHSPALEANRPMRQAVAAFCQAGGVCYAECGGLMYLARTLAVPEPCGAEARKVLCVCNPPPLPGLRPPTFRDDCQCPNRFCPFL